MEIILFAIVGIIVAVISAATKKKPKKQDGEQQAEQPVRPHISDIQRALMFIDEFDKGVPSAPSQQTQEPQPAQGASSWARSPRVEEMTSMEGQSTWNGVQHREPPVRKRPAAAKPVGAVLGKYAGVQLDRMDDAEQDDKKIGLVHLGAAQKGSLELGFSKNELVRAIVYSEILSKKF